MSGIIGAGIRSRRIMTVIAAILVAALMLAVPVLTAADADADFTATDAGYRVELKDPTDEQLTDCDINKDYCIGLMLISPFLIFDQTTLGEPTITADSFTVVKAGGEQISTNVFKTISVLETFASGVTITFTIASDGSLITSDIGTATQEYKDAADAIKAEFGENLSAGDKIIVTGTVNGKTATELDNVYYLLDGGKCAIKEEGDETFAVMDISTDIKLVKADSTEKSIKYTSTYKGMYADIWNYEYDTDPITATSHYTAKNTISWVHDGDSFFTVNDTDYTLLSGISKDPDQTGDAVLLDQSSMTISSSLITEIASLPNTSTDNMTISKEYSAASDELDSIAMDVIDADLLIMILIIAGAVIGIIVIIAIVVIVLVVVKKKH